VLPRVPLVFTASLLPMFPLFWATMSDAYRHLLEAAITDLERQQSQGRTFVAVSPAALTALKPAAAARLPIEPPPPAARLAPARTATVPALATAPRLTPMESIARSQSPPIEPALSTQSALGPEARAAAFADLRQRVLACVKCPRLVATRRNVVFGVGNPEAELMFVGEAPGADEDAQGEPFVGLAGQLLTKIIETMGLSRSEVFIANILKCRPDMPAGASGNRKPTPDEMRTCAPWLHEQIDLIRPRVLVALGATAVEGLLGGPVFITKQRGHWREYRGIPLMPTYHPAYLLRNQSLAEKRNLWEDMLAVLERLGRPVSEKQQRFFLKG
jgi:uracil-DNA glycosylase